MTDGPILVLTVFAAVGCALVGGVFFAFSGFVMRALADLPAPQGMAAMQSVNAAAPTPWFMAALFGTAAACAGLAVSSLIGLDEPGAVHRIVGSMLYLVAIALTIAYHVPRNDALAAADPNGVDAAARWFRYVAGWTAWNHVRAVVSVAAAAAFALALRAG